MDERRSEYRLMASWDTKEEDIEDFIALLKEELSHRGTKKTKRLNLSIQPF